MRWRHRGKTSEQFQISILFLNWRSPVAISTLRCIACLRTSLNEVTNNIVRNIVFYWYKTRSCKWRASVLFNLRSVRQAARHALPCLKSQLCLLRFAVCVHAATNVRDRCGKGSS